MNNVIQSSSSRDPGQSSAIASEDLPSNTQAPIRLYPSLYNATIGSIDDGRLQSPKRKRLDYLETFLRQLDSLLFVQFSILYYYDNTFSLFVLRATIQAFFLTPRPASLSESPLHRPSIGAIGTSNFWCLLLHLVRANPQAGEITEGFLHGGLVIDFVGELGPIWKWRLVAMDVLIISLQLIMLAGTLEKFSSKAMLPTIGRSTNTQDLDAEERGMSRDERSPERPGEEISTNESTLESSGAPAGHSLDELYTDDYRVANLSLLNTLRRQWGIYRNDHTSGVLSSTNVRTGNDMTMLFGGLLGVRLRFRGRDIRV